MQNKLAWTGAPLTEAEAAVILVHGRGASAESMLPLADELVQLGKDAGQSLAKVIFVAPQAPGYAWYPYSFLSPLERNEPALSQALTVLANMVNYLHTFGLTAQQMALVGFSQGACLALEFVVRHAQRYGGVAGLSGGLIGPPGVQWNFPGQLDGTPVFLGCSDVDPHIPKERVLESAQVLKDRGAEVTTRLYAEMDHTINEEELHYVHALIKTLV